MTRKKRDYSRKILPDPKYGDILVAQAINHMMLDGKRSVAERMIYKALNIVAEKTGKDALDAFHACVKNISPAVEVRSRRVGGANYQVPTEVRPERARSLALRWISKAANARTDRSFDRKLAAEILDALEGRGAAVKKREDAHRMAEANRAFAHFRW
jgi:small subunit ribosomal protein S7